jgi:predicted small secreted protein
MKKFATLIVALVASAALYAAPVGNTSAPDLIQEGFFICCDSWVNFRVGYEGDFVADGRMKQFEQGHGRVDTYQQDTNSGTVTLNILDRLDLYGVFGSSRTQADWRFDDAVAGTVTRIDMQTKYNFLWGAGARAILYEWCNTSLGVGGRYSSANYRPVWMTSDGLVQPVSGTHCSWREWQVNLDVSYKIDLFTPYIGIKYSNAQTKLKNFTVPISSDLTGSNSFKNRVPVGLYVGCALSTGKYFMLNIEGRLIDEEAVTISGDFRF